MTYKQTPLWIAAFVTPRKDSTVLEQERLAGCYEDMRQRASALVAKIAKDLPNLTIHDVTHLDALWEMASIASGDTMDLNPAEAFVFGGAVLLHDAAMTIAAFPGGAAELRQQTEWQDLHARYASGLSDQNAETTKEAEDRATADALRLLHAKQAENLPSVSWMGPYKETMFLIENQQVRNFYGPKIGKVSYSHWWPIAKVEEELSGTLGALPGISSCTVDLLKISCLLRVADAMHLDQRRAPAFDFALVQPSGVSADHWAFQQRMARPFVRGDALVYTAQPPFGADISDAWWTAFDALQMVDRELRDVDRLLRDRQKTPLAVRRVDGVQSPSDLARTVETVGWTPVDSTVRVSDVPNIVATLGGSKLYGGGPAAPVRELIQNGLDAITARRRLQSRPAKWGELTINLRFQEDGCWLSFEDNGVGMSQTVLTGPLIDFGNSFWKSALALQEFPGLLSSGMKARGKYGIGFFSVFMLGDNVRVFSRRYDRDAQSAKVLEFRHGLGSRPILRNADPKDVPLDGGTRVEVRLKHLPTEPNGILFRKQFYQDRVVQLQDMIAAIAPACDVSINVFEEGKLVGSTLASDWLEVSASVLLRRISGENATAKHEWEKLVELRDEEGRIYGRARIDPTPGSTRGLLTVDGLAASGASLIAGVLIGTETTASRNEALPIVPGHVLSAWASDQAIVFVSAAIPDAEKARVAAIVCRLGGSVAELPIIYWRGEWMNGDEFTEALEGEDELTLHVGYFDHDEDDYVTKRDFEASFEVHDKVAQTAGGSFDHKWIAASTKGTESTPAKIIERILEAAWGTVEVEDDTLVVGEVNGSEIYRSVTVYKRGQGEDEGLE